MSTKETTREGIETVRLEREKLKLKQEQKEFQETGKVSYRAEDKMEVELQRYKQDARKRALETVQFIIDKNDATATDPKNVIANAELYYNWLISIPEK